MKEFDQDSNVLNLAPEEWKELVNTNPFVVVVFFADWCPHCVRFSPEYCKIADELKNDNIPITAIDAVKYPEFAKQEQNVQGYPTVRFYFGNDQDHEEYQGPREAQSIITKIDDILEHLDNTNSSSKNEDSSYSSSNEQINPSDGEDYSHYPQEEQHRDFNDQSETIYVTPQQLSLLNYNRAPRLNADNNINTQSQYKESGCDQDSSSSDLNNDFSEFNRFNKSLKNFDEDDSEDEEYDGDSEEEDFDNFGFISRRF